MHVACAELLGSRGEAHLQSSAIGDITWVALSRRTTCCSRMRLGNTAEVWVWLRGEDSCSSGRYQQQPCNAPLHAPMKTIYKRSTSITRIVLDQVRRMQGMLIHRIMPDRHWQAHVAMRHSSNERARSHATAITQHSEGSSIDCTHTWSSPTCAAGLHAPAQP